MKKHRKQVVYVDGMKYLVDVPVDDELYKADNHNEYQRARSKKKDTVLKNEILADVTANVIEDFEKKQLLEHLYEAMQTLSEKERQLIKYLYFDGLSERAAGKMLGMSHQAVGKLKRKTIQKLRNSLVDWL